MKRVLQQNNYEQPAYNDIIKAKQRDAQLQTMLKSSSIPRQNNQTRITRSSTLNSQSNSSSNNNNTQKVESKKRRSDKSEQLVDKQNNQDDAITYYKRTVKQLKEQIANKDATINALKTDNDTLRTLNSEYVQSINDVIHKRVENIQRIVIDNVLFEGCTLNSDTKKLVQKLEHNIQRMEQQLKSFVKHCRVMEADIEVYRKKVGDADSILQALKHTGESSIHTLLQTFKNNDHRIQELDTQNSKLQYENCLNFEKIRNFQIKYGDIQNDYERSREEYQDLMIKHNRLINDSEQRKNTDSRTIYEMKCQNDQLEHELRSIQNSIQTSYSDKIESTLKVVELTQQNQSLRSTFMTSKRNSTSATASGGNVGGPFTVSFKQF